MKDIQLSDSFSLPPEVVGHTQAILAMKGAGKTYGAMRMAEGMVRAGYQMVAIDPTGVWWGLTTSADGKGPGVDVIVMGGEHGHVPLESTAGEYVAEFVVDSVRSVVLDTSLMRKAEQHRFMAAFLDRLYHYKAKHRASLHVFFDEADTAAPQSPGPEQMRVLGAAEDCVRRGRSRGLGMTLITQRPAVLNKNLLEMCDTLYVMRVIGANDQDAIRKRLAVDADSTRVSEVIASLARLEQGETFVFSPQALKTFERIKFGRRETFDSSFTPKAGKAVPTPKYRADINLDTLGEQIKATVQRAKDNDPGELRKRIAALEKQVATKPAAEVKTVDKPVVTDAQVKRVETIVDRMEREGDRRIKAGQELAASGQELKTTAADFAAALRKASGPMPAMSSPRPQPLPRREIREAVAKPTGDIAEWFRPAHQRLLDALAWLDAMGLSTPDRGNVAAIAGVSPSSSSFSNDVSRLSSAGLVGYPSPGAMALTDAGRALAAAPAGTPTIAEVHDAWRKCPALRPAHVRLLDALIDVHPGDLSRDELAQAAGVSAASSSFSNDVSRLSSLALARYPAKGRVGAGEILFPVGVV